MTKPKMSERLDKRLARVAREQGLCGALDSATQSGVLAGYYLMGGVAMGLRFGERARATKDLDLGMEGTRSTRLQSLSQALSGGFDQFTFWIKAETRDMDQADVSRVPRNCGLCLSHGSFTRKSFGATGALFGRT